MEICSWLVDYTVADGTAKLICPTLLSMALLLYFLKNFDYFASLFYSVCVLPISVVILCRKEKEANTPLERAEPDTPAENKKVPSRRIRRRGNFRRKRNRGNRPLKHQNTENMADPPSCINQPGNETTEDGDKLKMRKKSVLVSRSVTDISSNQNKTVKYYRPLQIFQQLQLEPAELYQRFQPYILQLEDLQRNGFPLFSPDNPGTVTFSKKSFKYNRDLEDPNHRYCCRCGEKYSVSDDGLYEAENVCCYHSGKRQGAGPFSCCGHYVPEGCVTNKHHVSAVTILKNVKYMKTREKRQLHAQHQIYALDCEMCYTMQGLEVTRVSIVGTDGQSIYDSYVLPESPIVDYNTDYSGVTANHLKNATTTLADVQAVLLKLLSSRTVLVGHGLENDLKALRLIHETVVDTSVVFPHHHGYPYKRSLKNLAASILKQTIQQSGQGHDSVEDARTCIELMLWKVQSDSQAYMQPKPYESKFAEVPVTMSHSQYHCHTAPVNPVSINSYYGVYYNVGYWAPPMGSPSEIYLGGQVTA